ncbi:MAG: DUF4268 domain-containing protein, partial [Crenarchaeota archaeon]|nr:DUF4268 domain-containing protein [Thermoproteota archaeon]
MAIGKLEKVPLREIWKYEEKDFSVWLEDNIDHISEILGLTLSVVDREKNIGSFQVDLVAEDGEGNAVIIENQLEQTDHDHLGKLLTYLINFNAKTAIWITKDARQEHSNVVSWLNEVTPVDISFYLLKVEAYKIGDSIPAPLFTVIVKPSIETKQYGNQKKELADRHITRIEFWKQLIERIKEKGIKLHSNNSPTKEAWLASGAGKTGLIYNYLVYMENKTAIELYIDTTDIEKNKEFFDKLFGKKQEIEASF